MARMKQGDMRILSSPWKGCGYRQDQPNQCVSFTENTHPVMGPNRQHFSGQQCQLQGDKSECYQASCGASVWSIMVNIYRWEDKTEEAQPDDITNQI